MYKKTHTRHDTEGETTAHRHIGASDVDRTGEKVKDYLFDPNHSMDELKIRFLCPFLLCSPKKVYFCNM